MQRCMKRNQEVSKEACAEKHMDTRWSRCCIAAGQPGQLIALQAKNLAYKAMCSRRRPGAAQIDCKQVHAVWYREAGPERVRR